MTIRLTAFMKYGRRAASTRQRLLQYVPALETAGITVDYRPLLDDDYVASLADGLAYSKLRIATDYLKRLREVRFGQLGNVIWVYGELFPGLPASFERLLVNRGRPIIYDFDDAFFHNYDDHPSALKRRMLGGKLRALMRAARACTCGNEYLRDYAARFCGNSVILPTAVDTDRYVPRVSGGKSAVPVIGWIGSPSTWHYVRPLLPLLSKIAGEGRAVVRVVGAGQDALGDQFPGLERIEWSERMEVAEIQGMDIGIMPLQDDRWARGKSGYKLIQYMACGLPVVASPVGINRSIVRPEENGLLASEEAEWKDALERLLADSDLRRRMGGWGRERAVAEYSLAVNAPTVVELVQSVARVESFGRDADVGVSVDRIR